MMIKQPILYSLHIYFDFFSSTIHVGDFKSNILTRYLYFY